MYFEKYKTLPNSIVIIFISIFLCNSFDLCLSHLNGCICLSSYQTIHLSVSESVSTSLSIYSLPLLYMYRILLFCENNSILVSSSPNSQGLCHHHYYHYYYYYYYYKLRRKPWYSWWNSFSTWTICVWKQKTLKNGNRQTFRQTDTAGQESTSHDKTAAGADDFKSAVCRRKYIQSVLRYCVLIILKYKFFW